MRASFMIIYCSFMTVDDQTVSEATYHELYQLLSCNGMQPLVSGSVFSPNAPAELFIGSLSKRNPTLFLPRKMNLIPFYTPEVWDALNVQHTKRFLSTLCDELPFMLP
ncbi:uncharacterized protein CLUP02_04934 [Colletotrichum lupini]|uniref:Uncharacterized protein n=1 Tax=Colletotrichum lupini TaxID=145971 RepID=A0A9Q8SLA5_9PEZI|nr:uncharacterized protein CLUP02_04934 [Colletotrichum lupini]UQC79454.1 hypothetical protein CLUP02_04934 [Colletotrichum lupini]